MSQYSMSNQAVTINDLPTTLGNNDEPIQTIEISDLPEGTVFHFENNSVDNDETLITGDVINPNVQYINLEDIGDTPSTASGSTYLYNQDTGEIQLIELTEATTINSNEVEVVTVDRDSLFTELPSSSNVQSFDGSFHLQPPSSASLTALSTLTKLRKLQSRCTPEKSSVTASPRLKSAPALLRNSRRQINLEKIPARNSAKNLATPSHSESSGSAEIIKGKSSEPLSTSALSSAASAPRKSKSNKAASQLHSNDSHHIVLLADSSNGSLENPCIEVQSGFFIYQNAEGEHVAELFPEAYLSQAQNNVLLQLDNSVDTKFLHDVKLSNPENASVKANKRVRISKKAAKKIPGSGALDVLKKANRGGGASELKCMEQGCTATEYNLAELRKHLTNVHDMTFDMERREFQSDSVFKEWRQHYERDRMVSFIYRGGTKKISKDQSVTYLICHRSGHYKPTMEDTAKRKRKMKPQGSCKIGGYCTAGIKLVKHLETGVIQADICHTHYGHPLDSEAIPHLRVNPVLKKLIVRKFEEGMNFNDMIAYIHHNPDGLEGLRVVDRRAIRNIYDTWKSKKSPMSNDETQSPVKINYASGSSSGDQTSARGIFSSRSNARMINTEDEKVWQSTMAETEAKRKSPSSDANMVLNDEPSVPVLYTVSDTSGETSKNQVECEDPPLLIAIDSVRSLRSDETSPVVTQKRSKRKSLSGKGKHVKLSGKRTIEKTANMSCTEARSSKVNVIHQPQLQEDPVDCRKSMLTGKLARKDSTSKLEGDSKDNITSQSLSMLSVNTVSSEKEDTDEDYFDTFHIRISPELESTIDKLHNHGEAGPSILLFKRIGETNTKYGGFCRAFKEDDFCLIIQTPVQRQIFQLFPKIVSLEILENPRPYEHSLKLVFLSVLDDFREAIPIAWMIADSVCTRYLNQLFRMLRYHCGELAVHYIIAPRSTDIFKAWATHFSHKPKMLQSEFPVKRDLRILLNRHFPNGDVRASAWNIVESLMNEKYINRLKGHKTNLEKISKKSATGSIYLRKMEKDWFPRIGEWSFAYRVGTTANLLFAEDCFVKLKKFVSFKGTKRLNQSVDHILKMGYDKCFLRTKRMFKGDQKLSKKLKELDEFHKLAVVNLKDASITEYSDRHVWKLEYEFEGKVKHEEVFDLQSPCGCKIRCKVCTICMHEYLCTCSNFIDRQTMCEHVHKVHCIRNNIALEAEPSQESKESGTGEEACPVGDRESEMIEETPFAGKVSSNRNEICEEPEITIINENDMDDLNITEVLGLLGQQSDGQELPKIVSITDVDTQKVYNVSNTSPLTIFQLDSD